MIDIKVPTVGESITEVTLVKWLKPNGSYVQRDEVIAELESEKATFELNAEQAGSLVTRVAEGETIKIGDIVASIDESAQTPAGASSAGTTAAPAEAVAPAAEANSGSEAIAAGKGVIEMKVPTVGESITEVTLVKWLKKEGDLVHRDEVLCELESEKATFELNAEESGQLMLVAGEGDVLKIGDVVAKINSDIAVPAKSATGTTAGSSAPATAPAAAKPASAGAPVTAIPNDLKATPVAAAIIADKKLDPKSVSASGAGGKIMKNDVLEALNNPGRKPGQEMFTRNEKREKMSNLRKTVSRRLVEAKNTTAMLTTFNEVDMGPIMAIRAKFKDKFKEIHGVNLGFMSFFTKAVTYALQEWPAVNAYIDGDSIIYHDYCDVSIAVSAPKGLVVPVIRNAESLSMAGIELKVVELATKARNNKLSMEEMQGGTFTITNGGVFGSLLSTPIINIPQSAILGMHKIQERPMVENGQVVVKQMMYLALSYDHRIIDGRESVGFLVRVKELLETPELLLFGKDPVKTLLEL